ncbi:MAG TPA: hypothetical protein VFV38_42720 [Ktedonobacteraceae bacterium]|nr:hypothetical protein [Ktedonobacteraceae bacterium]
MNVIDSVIIQLYLAPLIMLRRAWVFVPRRVLHRLQERFALKGQREGETYLLGSANLLILMACPS